MVQRTPDGVYRSTLLLELPWLHHGFGSRHVQHWANDYLAVRQVHSSVVAVAEGGAVSPEQADAIVTSEPGRTVGIRTADCVPLLLADARRRAVAAVHAGWRGTAANIAASGVSALRSRYGSDPADLRVAIGPCIGLCCFKVGQEVGERFRELFPEAPDLNRINLVEANRRQLLAVGVPSHQIDLSDLCTMCAPEEFHSFRRDGDRAGRMVAAIGIIPNAQHT